MNSMKEKLEERAVALNEILKEQNTGIQLVYINQLQGSFSGSGRLCLFYFGSISFPPILPQPLFLPQRGALVCFLFLLKYCLSGNMYGDGKL